MYCCSVLHVLLQCTACTAAVYCMYCCSVQYVLLQCTVCTAAVYCMYCCSVLYVLLQCTVCTLKSFTWNIDSLSHISQTLFTSSSVFLACNSWAAWMIGCNVSGTFVSCNKFSTADQQKCQKFTVFGVVNCKVLQDYTVQDPNLLGCDNVLLRKALLTFRITTTIWSLDSSS